MTHSTARPRSGPAVTVVGGGLAGITAALRCADAGAAVTLCEAQPRLGGLTFSFRRGDLWVDNGQHVFLRCCTRYRELLRRLDVENLVALQPRLDIPVRSEHTAARLRRQALPAPLHLSWSLLRYPWLSTADRMRFARAALALRGVDVNNPRSDATTFGDWLRAHGQSPAAIETLWELVGIATLNARADDVSLTLAATVFQLGLLSDNSASDIGWSTVPLQRLHGDAAQPALAAAGVTVRTRAKARSVRPHAAGWTLVLDDDEIDTDAVILAVPPAATARLLPAGAVDLPAQWADMLGSSPIVNVHVVYDRRVLDEPFLAGVDTPVQWVFDRSPAAGLTDGQYLSVSVSAADDLIGTPTGAIREQFLPALAALLPRARGARVREFFVTRERHATFRPAPGTARLRARATTTLPGLYLAGAWTETGWPATMEGAVRSGEAAASAVFDNARTPLEVAR
jgi:squalene-associated FAD-dependent desaturase